MKQFLLLGMAMLIGMTSHHVQGQMIIDTWGFTTGVDTTLWMDLGEDYTTLFAISNGWQNYASSGLRDIGFPFTLGTTTHTKFSTNVNGTVRLGTSQMPSNGYITEPLGQNINAGPRIDALGRAGMIDTSCYMRSAVLGDSGSRVLVVEARLREYADRSESEGHYVHFQVQLFEAGGLRVVYGQVDPGAIYGSSQNGVAATGNSSNKDVVFFDFASQRAVRFNGNCTLRNAAEVFPTKGRWYMIAPDPEVCPWPSTVTIPTNPDGGGVLLTRIAGDSNTMRVMIHAMDIDTVWEGTESTMVLPPVNPTTTYTLSLQTLCGSDTSYRTRDIDFFSGCGAVVRLPWETAFTTLSYSDCWDMPYVSGNNADFSRRWRNPQTGEIRCPGVSGTYNSWLKAPVFYLPDTNGITLKWNYKATASSGVSPHVELRVAPCDAEGTVVSDAEWVTVWTSDVEVASYTTYYANLDVWRGQRVRVAFVRTGEGGGTAYIDNVMLYQQQAPVFEWETPTVAHTGDTAIFSAAWLAGVDSNVTWIWHSALMDTTVVIADPTASTVPLVYTVAGWDTVTLIVSNVYGSDSAQAVVDVVDCSTIAAFPWMNDFTHSTDCWNIDGWTFQGSVSAYDFDGNNRYCNNVYYANNTGKYMLMQPVSVPATGAEHLSLWVEADGPLMVRVSPMASLDTATYTDTLLIVPDVSSRKEIWWRTGSLAAFAGQTVRAGFFKMDGTQAFISAVKIDYDTLPVLGTVSVANRSRTDSTNVCRAELRYGATDGLTFTWHSSLVDTTIVTTGSTASIAPIAYTVGGWDTITVVLSNAYGADTVVRVVQVMDCHPVLALPWREEFDDGLDCWYLTQNATYHQWHKSLRTPYVNNTYYTDYYAASQCSFSESSTTPADAWMVSRAVTLPADTALAVRLFWEVAISSGNNLTNNYRVMVSTAADCTDTTAYEELYHDTLPLPNQYNMAQRSVSLTPYAGQTIYIAFRNQPLVRRSTALLIDKVEVRETTKPRLLLAADNETFYHGDTATFTATLTEGSDSNLVYTWHSSLLDSTWVDTAVGGQWRLTYGMTGGMDTVTLVATNAYGSDTAMVCISSVIDSLPSISHIAHGAAFVGDTTEYTVVDNRSVVTGQTYTWHSTLLDTSIVLQSSQAAFRLVYTAEGNDTVTVVKSNVFGSSTSSAVVAVGSHPLPEVALTIPARVEVGVEAEFVASINDCSANGRTFTWHSTLLDTTVATLLPTLALMYEAEGTDTLTVIASNAYGADTAVTVLEVVDCSARAIPYTEDFEGVTATLSSEQGNLADCWDYSWNGSNAAYGPHVITTGGYQYISNIPDNALFLVAGSSTGYGNTAEVSLPRMADSLQNLSLAFDYRFESSSYGTLTVGYYNANNVFTTVKTMPAHNGSYRRDTVSFAAATVPDAAMVLRWYYGSSWYAVVIDNIEVITRDTLPVVRVEAPAQVVVGDSVHLCATLNDCLQNGLVFNWHSSLLDTTITLNSSLLTLNYTAGGTDTVTLIVSNAYGADTAVAYIYVVDCGNATLPYTEDFEGVTATEWSGYDGNMPLCWQTSCQAGSANVCLPHVVSSYQYMNNLPSNALFMVAASNSTFYSLWVQAVLPHFNVPLHYLSIAFDYRFEFVNEGTLTVGYVTDSLGYVAVDTLTPFAGSYQNATFHFIGTDAPADARIALRFERTSYFYAVAIDNIEVVAGNGIPAPTHLAADSVTSACATFGWNAVDSATAYHLVVKNAAVEGSTLDTMVGATAVTLCGLDESTAYTARVAALRGSDTGFYSPAVPFTTLPYCSALAGVTYVETGGDLVLNCQFDGTGETTPTAVNIAVTDLFTGSQWQTVGTGNGDTLTSFVAGHNYRVVVTALCSGVAMAGGDTLEFTMTNACSEVRGDYNDTYSFLGYYDQYAFNQMIYPAEMLGSVDTLFGIALRVSTAAPYNPGRKVNVFIDHTTSTSLASAAVSVTGMTQTAHRADFNTADTGWTAILFDTPFAYNGVDNLIVTVVDVTGRSSNGLGIGMHSYRGDSHRYLLWLSSGDTIDPYNLNFTTSYNNYRAPDIQFLGGCTNERCVAPVVVVDSATSNALYLRWQRQGNESHYQVEYSVAGAGNWTIADTTTATAYTLSGLAVGTLYQVRVGAVCDDGTILYRTATVAGTLCGPVSLPHYSDFAIAPGHCWTSTGSYSENNGYSLNGHSFSNPNMLISPEVAGGLHNASVTIRARDYSSYDDARYAVGVSNADGSEVVWIDTVDFTDYNSFEDATVYLNSYTGYKNHVAIAGILSYTLVRSVSIDPLVGCLPVQRAWANRITDTSATLHWIPEQTGDHFLVYLGDSLMTTTTDTFFTFTGLAATTAYTARVVEQCSDGGLSVPVSVDFTTACTPLALPWSEDFNSVTIGEMPSCWTTHLTRRYVTLAQVAWPDSWLHGSCRYLHLKSEAGTAANPDTTYKNYASTPLLNVGNHGAVVTISAQGNYGSLLQVGVMTDPSDPSTFVSALEVPLHPNGFDCSNFVTYQFSTDTLGMLPDVWSVAFHWKGVSVSMVSEVSVVPIIVPTHDLTLAVNDTAMGSVSGAGTYEEGTNVTITATANEGYHFVTWSDGITASTRTVKVDFDTSFTAFFAPDTLWHIVTVGASNDGACQTYGSGTYIHGDTIEIGYHLLDTASAGGHWVILGWNDGNADNPRQVVVTSDTTFTLLCQWVGDSVGINDAPEGNNRRVNIYPNPATTTVRVECEGWNAETATLLDLNGRVVSTQTIQQSNSQAIILDISMLPRGTYFLRLTDGTTTAIHKLILQ